LAEGIARKLKETTEGAKSSRSAKAKVSARRKTEDGRCRGGWSRRTSTTTTRGQKVGEKSIAVDTIATIPV
jgi:hypothetical protein